MNQIPNIEEEEQKLVKHLVDRFLGWRLPKDFHPDGGIMFMDVYENGTEQGGKFEPVGTNLFTAEQAKEMFRFLLEHEDGTPILTELFHHQLQKAQEELSQERTGFLDHIANLEKTHQEELQKARERLWLEANKLPIHEGRADLISLLDLQLLLGITYHSELDQDKRDDWNEDMERSYVLAELDQPTKSKEFFMEQEQKELDKLRNEELYPKSITSDN